MPVLVDRLSMSSLDSIYTDRAARFRLPISILYVTPDLTTPSRPWCPPTPVEVFLMMKRCDEHPHKEPRTRDATLRQTVDPSRFRIHHLRRRISLVEWRPAPRISNGNIENLNVKRLGVLRAIRRCCEVREAKFHLDERIVRDDARIRRHQALRGCREHRGVAATQSTCGTCGT